MNPAAISSSLLSCYLLAGAFAVSAASAPSVPPPATAAAIELRPAWSPEAAAKYLDGRESWWLGWSVSQRDHGTACVSCHTALPYALSRRTLRSAMHESAPNQTEEAMLANIRKRVALWSAVDPFYTDKQAGPNKTVESRGTEAVLNALVLAAYDSEKGVLSEDTRTAFANAWSLQLKDGSTAGAWTWLNFHNAPWEGNESQYMGAAFGAVAVGIAPDRYAADPAIQPNLKALREYLGSHFSEQPVFNQVVALWASAKLPGLLSDEQRATLLEALSKCQNADGGWSLSAIGNHWTRRDNTPVETQSDGYATGLIVFTLEQTGAHASSPQVEKGLAWLRHNQDVAEGRWLAYSVNKNRVLSSDIGHFMSDAATAYAVMALRNTF